jgi:hypothetical protein
VSWTLPCDVLCLGLANGGRNISRSLKLLCLKRNIGNAIVRFDHVEDVSDAERDLAFANIKRAAEHFGIGNGGNGLAPPRLAVPRVEAAVWTKMR